MSKFNLGKAAMKHLSVLLLVISPLLGTAWAQEPEAGTLTMSIGEVKAVGADKISRMLHRSDPVFSQDMITTGKNGFAQIRFSDDSIMTVRASTQFKISEYHYQKDTNKDRMHLEIGDGGVRSLTGLIAKVNKSNYSLKNPVATLGIRGTDFTAYGCGPNCNIKGVRQGFYVGVSDGSVAVANDNGTLTVKKGEYSQTEIGTPPALIQSPPGALMFPPPDSENGAPHDALLLARDLVRVALVTAPELKNEIIKSAANVGINDIDIINLGLNANIDIADIAGPLLRARQDPTAALRALLSIAPNRVGDILTAGYAQANIDVRALTFAAQTLKVPEKTIRDSGSLGNLVRPRDEGDQNTGKKIGFPGDTNGDRVNPILLPGEGTGNGRPLSDS